MRVKLNHGEVVDRLRVELLCSVHKSMKGQMGTQSEVLSLIHLCIILRKSKVMEVLTV